MPTAGRALHALSRPGWDPTVSEQPIALCSRLQPCASRLQPRAFRPQPYVPAFPGGQQRAERARAGVRGPRAHEHPLRAQQQHRRDAAGHRAAADAGRTRPVAQ